MRLIFIRHGEPDYANDSLTEKGIREAALLAKRVATWDNITDYYVSPLGRAQLTCKYSMDEIGRTAETLDWLREFHVVMENPSTHERSIPWDFYPDYWRNQPILFDKDKWQDFELYKDTNLKEELEKVNSGLDTLLSKYGVIRDENVYRIDHENDDTTLVLFCHLGVSYVCLGHLLGISPALLWHTFFTAPTSVTVVDAEEREKGTLNFRVQVMGDTRHLDKGNEPISYYGIFTDLFYK